MDRALVLSGRQSMPIINNQPIVGGCVRGDFWVEARGRESVWGGHRPIVQGSYSNNEKRIYIYNTAAQITQQSTIRTLDDDAEDNKDNKYKGSDEDAG